MASGTPSLALRDPEQKVLHKEVMEIVQTSSHLGGSNYLLQHSAQVRLFSKMMKPRVMLTETLLCLFDYSDYSVH